MAHSADIEHAAGRLCGGGGEKGGGVGEGIHPATTYDQGQVDSKGEETPGQATALHRGLKARHITMIAIGGAIGTGLIIGTGKALATSGPGSVFIAYTFVGFIIYLVMGAIGEMSAWLPLPGGFTSFATRFCDPSLGFALGWCYWFKYIILPPSQLTAGALVLQYWVPRDKVNPGVFIAIFIVAILAINYFGIEFFGEFEFWLSLFKVVAIIGVIIFTLVIVCGGGPDHDVRGFRYWNSPGAFKEHITTGNTGKFLGFWSCMITAVFAYQGTELIGVTVAEAQNPRCTIPKAIRLTFWRIAFFYCSSALLVGMLVPYNSEKLLFATKSTTGAAASPFVVGAIIAGVEIIPHIINGAIFLFVFSAANSDLYIASRTLHSLALTGSAPRFLKYTNKKGVPVPALLSSAVFTLLAMMNVSDSSATVFQYFVNMSTMFGLTTWISVLVTHIFWCRARRAQKLTDDQLPYVAPFGVWGSKFALVVCIIIAITKNYEVFTAVGDWKNAGYKNFITGYIGIPLYLILLFGHKIIMKTHTYRPMEVDFWTGKAAIDEEEEAFLVRKAEKDARRSNKRDLGWFYRRVLSYVF